MPSSPSVTPTPITPPRVAMIDPRTGLIDRAWYMFFLSLFSTATAAQDADLGPSTDSLLATFDAQLRALSDEVGTQYDAQSGVASLAAALAALEQQFAVQPSTEIGELQQQIDALAQAAAIQPAALPLNSGAFFNIIGPATAGSVAYGDGSAIAFSAAGSSGQLLASSGTGAPTWTSLSSIGSAPITKTANFTVGVDETWYINNKTGSACTVTLPTASSYTGRELKFVNYQAQTLISASSNVVPLGGGSAGTAILAASVGDWATLVSDGTNWIIMQAAANNCLLLE